MVAASGPAVKLDPVRTSFGFFVSNLRSFALTGSSFPSTFATYRIGPARIGRATAVSALVATTWSSRPRSLSVCSRRIVFKVFPLTAIGVKGG